MQNTAEAEAGLQPLAARHPTSSLKALHRYYLPVCRRSKHGCMLMWIFRQGFAELGLGAPVT